MNVKIDKPFLLGCSFSSKRTLQFPVCPSIAWWLDFWSMPGGTCLDLHNSVYRFSLNFPIFNYMHPPAGSGAPKSGAPLIQSLYRESLAFYEVGEEAFMWGSMNIMHKDLLRYHFMFLCAFSSWLCNLVLWCLCHLRIKRIVLFFFF